MSSCNDPCADNISIIVDTGSAGPIGPPGPAAKVLEWTFYLNSGDTIVSGDDASAKPLAYTPDSVQVYLNGVQLSKRDDYTTDADGNSIVLNEAIVNANDILVVISQVPPEEGYDPTNDFDRLDGKIQDNTDAITGLDVRVTANEEAIEGLTGLAGGFTTRDVKLSGVNTTRSVDEPLETQQNLNVHFDGLIAANEERLDAIEGGQPDLTSDIADLRTDVDENTQGISDNAQALNDLVDVVEANANGIDGLQTQIDKLPPPTDISDLEKDVDDIAKSVAGNTIAISKNTADIAALDEPVDLDPLNAAIATNAAGISQNAKDITSLKATDAKHTGEISDLQTSVGHLEAIDIPDNYAVVDEDNSFETSQTIKGGISITGTDAFVKADTGSAVTFSNNNAYNPVIEIERSNGDVSLAFHADGHIRGVKTDENDDSSAVSVGWFQDNVGAGGDDTDLSKYATKIELKTEEFARIQGDDLLAKELEDAISTQKYDDTKLTNRIAQEEAARKAADSSLDGKISTEAQYREDGDDALQAQLDALPGVDPALYATIVAMEKGDADTLAAANTFTTEAIADIEFPDGVDLTGLASEEWVTEQIADFATENFVEEAIGAIEFPDGVDLTGYATEEFVTDAIAAIEDDGATSEEKIALIEAQIQFRGLMELDADDKPVWPADQTKERGGWWAYPSSKFANTWKYENLEWIFTKGGDDNDVTKDASPKYAVGDIIQMQISDNEAGAATDWQYLDTSAVFVEYKVEELYYPDRLSGNANTGFPAYRVSKSAPDHRYTGSLPNVVKGPQGDPSDAWIQWYPTTFAFGTTASDGGDLISRQESKADDRKLQAEVEQIALGLETLLTQRTHGQWKYIGFSGDNIPRNAGEFALISDDLSAADNLITINLTDLNGITVGLGDVDVGDYIEIVDLDEPANYALFTCTKKPEGSGISNIEVSLKDKGQNFLIGETCEIRFFAVNEENINISELDDRYLKLSGGTMANSAQLSINYLKPVNLKHIQYECDPTTTHPEALVNLAMVQAMIKAESGGDQATLPEWTLSPFKFGTMAAGKMAFFDGDANGTDRLEAARGVVFSAIDANGNRVCRNKDGVDWERDFGGALTILYDDDKTLLSMARSHGSVPAVIYHMAEIDAYTIIWPADKDAVVTSNITHVVHDQNYKIHCPDIIF